MKHKCVCIQTKSFTPLTKPANLKKCSYIPLIYSECFLDILHQEFCLFVCFNSCCIPERDLLLVNHVHFYGNLSWGSWGMQTQLYFTQYFTFHWCVDTLVGIAEHLSLIMSMLLWQTRCQVLYLTYLQTTIYPIDGKTSSLLWPDDLLYRIIYIYISPLSQLL